MNNIVNLLILILILISSELLINANNTNNNTNNNSTSTYLRRNLDSSNSKLCECGSVICGLCMTGCSPSTSNDCKSRNWCYCNLMKIDCYEDKYQVCGLLPTSKPTFRPSSKPTFKPSSFSPTNNPSLGIYL